MQVSDIVRNGKFHHPESPDVVLVRVSPVDFPPALAKAAEFLTFGVSDRGDCYAFDGNTSVAPYIEPEPAETAAT